MIKITGKNLYIEVRLGLRYRLLKLLGLYKEPPEEDSNAPVLVQIHKAQLYVDKKHQLPHYLRDWPLYDSALPAIARSIHQRLGRQILVVDVGANIGDSAAVIAAAIPPGGARFMCVEADDRYLPLFEINTKGLDAKLVHAIAGQQSGKAKYHATTEGAGTSVIEPSETETEIVTVDELVGSEPVDLLKIDTDGYEHQVLSGAKETLQLPDVTVFMEYSPFHLDRYGKTDPERVIDVLVASGFQRAIVYDNLGFLMGQISLEPSAIRSLTRYALSRPGLYYDLVLHKDPDLLDTLMTAELARIETILPKRTRFDIL